MNRLVRRTQPPEPRFISLCVREPGAVASSDLLAAAASVCDWGVVAELAARHRVAAYVLQAAHRAGIDLPEIVRATLRTEMLASQAVVMLLESELHRIARALAEAAVPHIVLKGPVLARTVYQTPELRPYADLDVNVQQSDESTAVAVLTTCGFAEMTYEAEAARLTHAGHLHHGSAFHRLFADADQRTLVELHLDPLQLGLRPNGEAARWTRSVPVPHIPGARMLAPEDQLVQLSVHVHKHGFSRLIWLKDIDLLMRAHADTLDWTLVEEAARAEGVCAGVWYTLQLTHRLLGTPVRKPAAALRPALLVRLLYRAVWPTFRVTSMQGFLRRRAVQFHAAESWSGMLPSLILMGRRRERASMLVHTMLHR